MLNAGRGNPNFLATIPRHAFFQLGLFAMEEVERNAAGFLEGVAGMPIAKGISTRFKAFAKRRRDQTGIGLLTAALSYALPRLA